MKLDRALQLAILEKLAAKYPEHADLNSSQEEGDPVTVNAWYLEEHGLIDCIKSQPLSGPPSVIAARITARGLDFLADDSGLSAILGVVTVKLHADTVRDLLKARIDVADLPADEKRRLTDHLRALPAEALKQIATRLLDEALDRLPNAIQLLRQLLGS